MPNHSIEIISILNHIENFISEDRTPILPECVKPFDFRSLPGPEQIISDIMNDRERCIEKLNGAIINLIAAHGYNSPKLKGFFEEYDVPIQFASNLGKSENFNMIDKYKVISRIESQGSSTVWMAVTEDAENEYYAIKVLSNLNFNDPTERDSFRRGIESLFLLNASGLNVSPSYVTHREAPLSVIMSFVNGSTLLEYSQQDEYRFVDRGIFLFRKICLAIDKCHKSRSSVLHRDLKPSNIMLENWFVGYDDDEIVVKFINFDLSWHSFSYGNTKNIGAAEIGYYAPEQKNALNSLPARTSATDVYMLGMVLYSMILHESPPEGGAQTKNWEEEIERKVSGALRDQPLVANRASRLICDMTRLDTKKRPDLLEVLGNISGTIDFLTSDRREVDPDIIIEDLCCFIDRGYHWDLSAMEGRIMARPEKDLRIQFSNRGQRVLLKFNRTRSDGDSRAGFGARINQRITEAGRMLSDSDWELEIGGGVIRSLTASIRVSDLIDQGRKGFEVVKGVADHLLAEMF